MDNGYLDNAVLDTETELVKMIGLRGYDFRLKRTLKAGSGDVPVNFLDEEQVKQILKALNADGRGVILEGFIVAVSGGTGATDVGDLKIQTTADTPVDLVTITGASLTANAYLNENSGGVTLAGPYRLKNRIADLKGLQAVGTNPGASDDVVIEVWGRIA